MSLLLLDAILADYQLAFSSEKPCGQHSLGRHQGPEEPQAVAGELAHAAEEHQGVSEKVTNGYHAAEIARSALEGKLL